MNAHDHDQFWQRYDREVRPAVERACRQVSRLHADNTMEPGDMASWVHTRVWRMLEKQAFPTFHDNPSADLAIERRLALFCFAVGHARPRGLFAARCGDGR